MELLGGLAFLGHIINKTPENKTSGHSKKHKKVKTSGNNLYDNDTYNESMNVLKKKQENVLYKQEIQKKLE